MTTQERYEFIDRYLNDQLSESERRDFEQRILQDETFRAELDQARDMEEAIHYGSLAELKQTVGQDIKKIPYKNGIDWTNARYLSIAVLIIASGITTYYLTTKQTPDTGTTISVRDSGNSSSTSSVTDPAYSTEENVKTQRATSITPEDNTRLTKDSTISTSPANREDIISQTQVQTAAEEKVNLQTEQKSQNDHIDSGIQNTSSVKESQIVCDKTFTVNTTASCKSGETGSMTIVSDGATDYTFQVDDQHRSGHSATFRQLATGQHQLHITYGKECMYTKAVTVTEKWCPMNEAFSFNPDYNEKWMPKYEAGTSGTFRIFDASGKEIYRSAFGSGNEQWNGTDLHGNSLPLGVYIGHILYTDGRQEKVELTIVR